MKVGNFTPDIIEWWHIGVNGFIKPGETVDMEDGRANHILNKFSQIGLVRLDFGDDVEAKKAFSMEMWRQFWERMIEGHNQANEDAKEKGNRYTKPKPELEEKARLFGLELKSPWRVERTENKEIATLKDENASLKKTVDNLSDQMAKLISLMSGKTEEKAPTIESDIVVANRKRYKPLRAAALQGWIKNNWEEIMEMPDDNKYELVEQYQAIYNAPFPDTRPV